MSTVSGSLGRIGASRRSSVAQRESHRGVVMLSQLHERLLGRETFSLAAGLEVSQWQSREATTALQMEKLRRLVAHAARCCPYYRALHLLPPEELARPGDLAKLPLLTRNMLREHAEEMRWSAMPGRMLTDRTHGTRDEPFAFYCDRRRQAWDKANRLRGHRWQGFEPGDRELHLWPVDPPMRLTGRVKQQLRHLRDRLLCERQLDILTIDDRGFDEAWGEWRAFDPDRVTAYPSSLARFLRGGGAALENAGSSSLRTVFLTGEVTVAWQERAVREQLGAAAAQCYGLQEAGAIAFECEQGSWHVCDESVMVEIVREGRAARAGELGEVVVTAIESRAMPVIRYCTGDVVRAGAAACACGRGLSVMPRVLGRTGDFLNAADGEMIEPASVVASLAGVLEDGAYQVRQDEMGSVELSTLERFGDRGRGPFEAARRLAKLIGAENDVSVRRVADLERSRFGKCRYVQSAQTELCLAQPRDESIKQSCQINRQPPTPRNIPPRP